MTIVFSRRWLMPFWHVRTTVPICDWDRKRGNIWFPLNQAPLHKVEEVMAHIQNIINIT